MQEIARQFLRALRGTRSQVAFSRRLGYRSNAVANWEAGRSFPNATEALRACARAGHDVPAAILAFDAESAAALGEADDAGVAAWLRALKGGVSHREVAERTGHSRFAIGRWMAGRARPKVPEFFELVEVLTGRLSDLLVQFVPLHTMPTLQAVHREREATRHMAYEAPWSGAILQVIESQGYIERGRHDTAYVAKRLGIDESIADEALRGLASADVIRMAADGRYALGASPLVDTAGDRAALDRVRVHWNQAVSGRLQRRHPQAQDLFGYNLAVISDADYERVRTTLVAAFTEARAICAGSKGGDRVMLLQVHLIEWPDP